MNHNGRAGVTDVLGIQATESPLNIQQMIKDGLPFTCVNQLIYHYHLSLDTAVAAISVLKARFTDAKELADSIKMNRIQSCDLRSCMYWLRMCSTVESMLRDGCRKLITH